MAYIFDDEDNVPMNEENFRLAHDHDCENCRHKVNGECDMWDCRFAPKGKGEG